MKKILVLAALLSMLLTACIAPPATDLPADASVSDSAESSDEAATAEPAEESGAVEQDSSGQAQAGPSVMLTFRGIDDKLEIFLNGESVYQHNRLRYEQPKLEIDLSDQLIPGTNELQIVAAKGEGWADLVGSIALGEGVILRVVAADGPGSTAVVGSETVGETITWLWDVSTESYGHGVFVDETYEIELE